MNTLRSAEQRDWTEWANGYQWNITGTLNFVQNRKPPVVVAVQRWRSFLNIVDRIAYGKTYQQRRVPRFTCLHLGGDGDNPHLQFTMLWRGNPAPFCVALNAIWSRFSLAAPPADNEITPTICQYSSLHYAGHEAWFQGSDSYLVELMHRPETIDLPVAGAIARLNAYAKPIWLKRAREVFPLHVARAQQGFDIRHASKV